MVRHVGVPALGATVLRAGAVVWACDCLHWMLSTLMCSNAAALVGHVRVPAWGHGCALMLELLFGHVSVLLTLVL